MAAIGPIYSDEILWEAGLRHDRISSELSSQEIRRLFRALVETLHEAVKHRGTTVDDHPFVDLYGKPGDYQDELKVYGREGEPCRRCRAPVAKVRFANKPALLLRGLPGLTPPGYPPDSACIRVISSSPSTGVSRSRTLSWPTNTFMWVRKRFCSSTTRKRSPG